MYCYVQYKAEQQQLSNQKRKKKNKQPQTIYLYVATGDIKKLFGKIPVFL